ncbi:MAG TPA: A/G-specific adenine glycosylase [Longimicrobiales bacterium]
MPKREKPSASQPHGGRSRSIAPARPARGTSANGAAAGDPGGPGAVPIDAGEFRRSLLRHYDVHRRELPWRRDADPYRVWVSEIMLQQTRVDAVVPYYERWMRRFPTLDALADADVDDVLRHWQGLGYYARARNLHRAARIVRERHRGRIPDDPAALRRLPGVGEYTAGAIASIAYGIAAPAVDANVRRVFSRLLDDPDPAPAVLRQAVEALVPPDRPGDFNQALMELGATVCTPRAPACDRCPVKAMCRAHANGTVAERPRPKASRPLPEDIVGTAVIVAADGALLLARRPAEGLLGGLWEFPGAVAAPGEAPVDAARRAALAAVDSATAAAGDTHARDASIADPVQLGAVVHTFSHRRVTYHAFVFATSGGGDGGRPPRADRAWVAPDAVSGYALPTAQRRVLERFLDRWAERGDAGAPSP